VAPSALPAVSRTAVAVPPLHGPPVRMNVPVHREPSGRGYYAGPGYDGRCYWQRQRFSDGYDVWVRNVRVCD
jgi:hypothetical protein